MKRVLTPEMEKYFIENAMKESIKSMSQKFGVSDSVVDRVFRIHNVKVPRELQLKFKSEAQRGRTTFTPEETEFIQDNYLTMPLKVIAAKLNRSDCGIRSRMRQLGLKVPESIIAQRKKESQYSTGSVPQNKGKKQADYMSAEAIERTKATRFKKGQLPPNTLPEGSEVIRKDKNGRDYLMIKVPGKTKLVYKQIWLWEQQNGIKLPKGHNIIFKNGDSLDCRIENLECISDSELMSRNTLHRFPEEVRNLILMKGAINRQINKHQKQKK